MDFTLQSKFKMSFAKNFKYNSFKFSPSFKYNSFKFRPSFKYNSIYHLRSTNININKRLFHFSKSLWEQKDYYAILGVSKNATDAEIKAQVN